MNGPFRSEDVDDPRIADYSIGLAIIYIAFPWSEAEEAYALVRGLAEAYRVGFYDVSGTSEIIYP